jgi:hypothetical protein
MRLQIIRIRDYARPEMLIWKGLAPSRLARVLAWMFGARRAETERASRYAPASQSIRD